MKIIYLLILLFSFLINVNAADWYVRNNGSNTSCNGHTNVDYSVGVAPNCAYQTGQKAVDDSALGDFIYFHAGETFTIATASTPLLQLKDKGVGSSYITLTTDGTIPSIISTVSKSFRISSNGTQYYIRLTTNDVVNMPKLQTTNGFPVVDMNTYTHHYKFVGLEFTSQPATGTATALIVGGAYFTIAQIPHHLIFDQCYLHPIEEDGTFNNIHSRSTEMAFEPGGWDNFEISNCVVQGFTGWDRDSVWIGNTPISGYRLNANSFLSSQVTNGIIRDSLMEANGQIFFGGGGTDNPAHIGNCTNWTTTSATGCTNTTDLEIGTYFRVYSSGVASNHLIPNDRHNMTGYQTAVGPYANAKIVTVNHSTGDITFTILTLGYDYRRFWAYFFDATGGTFTLTWMGQTTSAITYPSISITDASNTNPITITTSGSHGFTSGDTVYIWGVGGNIIANGYSTITVTGSNTFTIPKTGSGTYTSGGNTTDETILSSNIQTALIALSNVGPSDVIVTFNTDWETPFINFNIGTWAYPTAINKLTVDGTNLTGANDPAWVGDSYSESYKPLENSQNGVYIDIPLNNAEIAWKGYQSHDLTVERCIIAQPHAWYDAGIGLVKGFVEVKGADHVTWNGNIFAMRPTGFVYTVRNQGGGVPWASDAYTTFSNNIFTETGYVFALVLSDTNYQSDDSTNILVENNLLLWPKGSFGTATETAHLQGGDYITFNHNTFFVSRELSRSISAQPTNHMVWTNNVIRPANYFFGCFDGPGPCHPNSSGGNNLLVNNLGLDAPTMQNWYDVIGANTAWEETDETAIFESVSPNQDNGQTNFDGAGNYRIKSGSRYKAGGDRQASDGKDVGVDYTQLITALGFDPFQSIKKCNWHTNPRCNQ